MSPGTKRLLLLTGIVALSAGVVEFALHTRPDLIPASYRKSFPLHGAEFFEPELFRRTPVEGLPLPLYVGAYAGAAPSDLIELGVVAADVALDQERYPMVRIPVDELGLPNPPGRTQADVVMVGDSFVVSASSSEPAGLRTLLEEASGRTVYDLAVSGIGPLREAWLLNEVGLAKEPRAVLWFFFEGNDAIDALAPLIFREQGKENYADVHAARRPPRWILPDLLRHTFAGARQATTAAPLPGFQLARPDGAATPIWFHPIHLRQSLWSKEIWGASPGWQASTESIRSAFEASRAAGAEFLLVFLPTKARIYLPLVEQDPALTFACASFGLAEPLVEATEDNVLERLAQHGDALEVLMREFCAREGIPFLSATPHLSEFARSGELAYLQADTHWQPAGQSALLEPLLGWLERSGAFD